MFTMLFMMVMIQTVVTNADSDMPTSPDDHVQVIICLVLVNIYFEKMLCRILQKTTVGHWLIKKC